ncbi:MAG: GNAT family N-acetyltransferase [Planctomycetota bacterium]|nr:MAG: GNAT family N-acetyltransferase [Planctomycetota bacterium]
METTLGRNDQVVVRGLRPEDMDAVVALDARNTGKRRKEYFKVKLQQNLSETGVKVSLAAELDGMFVGFLLARVMYGEFGQAEQVAVLDTINVHSDFSGKKVGGCLLDQLAMNLRGLGVDHLQTQVGWDDMRLMAFFQREGFKPAPRICIDFDLTAR